MIPQLVLDRLALQHLSGNATRTRHTSSHYPENQLEHYPMMEKAEEILRAIFSAYTVGVIVLFVVIYICVVLTVGTGDDK